MIPMKFNRSRYTIEVSYLQDDPNFDVFSFDYDFYEPQLKKEFENLFLDHYRYSEICCESVERWQRMLMSRLNMIMPYYTQLYQTELASKKIDFLLNKDYTETDERTYTSDSNGNVTGTDDTTSTSNSKSNTDSNHKESVMNNINASIGDDKLTGMSNDNNTDNTDITSTNKGTNTSTSNDKTTITEKNVLTGKGNIGITSSAELLQKWRDVIININKLIIDECYDLFFLF